MGRPSPPVLKQLTRTASTRLPCCVVVFVAAAAVVVVVVDAVAVVVVVVVVRADRMHNFMPSHPLA